MRRRSPSSLPSWFAVLLALALLVAPPAAQASCEDCPGPTWAELRAQPGFVMVIRRGPYGALLDYLEVDGGECRVVLEDTPTIRKTGSWLVLRATGEVWNCPHSASTDRVVIETREGDSTDWTLSGTVAAELDAVVASVRAQLEAGISRGASITEVTRVEKTITAAWCRRIPWEGYFEIARYEAVAHGRVERRYAWWTKNLNTGSVVHVHGEMWVHCTSGEILLWRRAAIAGFFHLSEASCKDPACAPLTPRDLGWFPDPPPPPPQDPVVTPRGDGDSDSAGSEGGDDVPFVPPGEAEDDAP